MPPKKTAAVGVRKKTPKSLYQRPEPVPKGSVFTDLARQQWKIGPPIGTGGFGDIYSACKASDVPKNADGYQYVVKIVSLVFIPWGKKLFACSFMYFIYLLLSTGTQGQWTPFCRDALLFEERQD